MGFFSKSKDYHNLLEEILDEKTFSSIAKSLCLSLVYKLEIAYKDYAKVKVDCITKDVFLESIFSVIKKYCEHIKIVEPESHQANLLIQNKVQALTNTKERSILAYPTEIAMLEAICEIEPKYFFIEKNFPNRNILQKILVKGYKQNTMEILKNFNGWSWDIDIHEKMDYIAHIIYQNLMMIMGESFLCDWRTDRKVKKNYFSDLKTFMKKVTKNEDYNIALGKVLSSLAKGETGRNELIELQKSFLKFIKQKIERVNFREEIIKMLYQLRLYQNLNFEDGKLIKDCDELKKQWDAIFKLVITKACKLGILKIISMDIETNFEIFRCIFDTRMIDLEQIKIYLEIENETIYLKVYDKEVFEKQETIHWTGNKKDIVIRKKKMTTIFI